MLTAQAEVYQECKEHPKARASQSRQRSEPAEPLCSGFRSEPASRSLGGLELLLANGGGVWARSLARTGRLHSAAVRDIVLL
jgi:hypothetical protein